MNHSPIDRLFLCPSTYLGPAGVVDRDFASRSSSTTRSSSSAPPSQAQRKAVSTSALGYQLGPRFIELWRSRRRGSVRALSRSRGARPRVAGGDRGLQLVGPQDLGLGRHCADPAEYSTTFRPRPSCLA